MLPELESSFSSIESKKKWFVDRANEMGAEKAGQRVQTEEWSLTEVIEHLVIAERNFTAGFEGSGSEQVQDSFKLKIRRRVILFVLRNAIKVPTPSVRVIPKGQEGLDSLLPEWDNLRSRLKVCLDEKKSDQLGNLTFKHPRAGDLDALNALAFLENHMTYHQKRAVKVFGVKL
jgi:uncharacterized damage-inducible protein DinB